MTETDRYTVLLPDGGESDPIDLAGLQQWAREGRIQTSTRIRKNGGAAIAAEFMADVAPLLGSTARPPASPNPSASGGAPSGTAPASTTATAVALPETFRAWAFIGLAWQLVKPHWLVLGLMLLIMMAVGFVPIIGACASLVLNGVFMVGVNRALLGILEGRAPEVDMLFKGFDRFGQAFLAWLVTTIGVALGIVLLIVPGIILSLMWMFTSVILADTPLEFSAAMSRSAELTRGYRWRLFGLVLSFLVVLLLGLLVCGVGILVAQPVVLMATVLAYRFLQRAHAATTTA